jgi:hypothetical protein
MKNSILAIALMLVFAACNNNKEQEKKLFDEVIKLHDEAMADNGRVMDNKARLDSLLKLNSMPGVKDTAAEKAQIRLLNAKLVAADDAMMDWMHKFEPDYKGKPHDEVVKYMEANKKHLKKVDEQLNMAIKESGAYLSKTTKK